MLSHRHCCCRMQKIITTILFAACFLAVAKAVIAEKHENEYSEMQEMLDELKGIVKEMKEVKNNNKHTPNNPVGDDMENVYSDIEIENEGTIVRKLLQ